MSRADVTVSDAVSANQRSCGQSCHIVRTAGGVWYRFFISISDADPYYQKTTNYGLTWGSPVSLKATTCIGIATWFDKWTPGDSGTLIHIAYMESAGSDVFYRSLDTASDTLGTERTVFAGASFTAGASTCLSITKSKAGRILVAFDGDGGTETGFYKSDDYPVTAFSAMTDLNEATSDYYQLFPGNDADTADIWALYWDRSADELTLKVYDDSGNSWSEATIIAGTGAVDLASTTLAPQFAGAVRNSDGHLLAVAWSAYDTANADLRSFDINGAASITEMTNVVLNSVDDQGGCAICVDTTADKVTVFYFGKSDGSETANTSMGVYYKESANGMSTWGAETTLSTDVRARSYINCSLETDSDDLAVEYGGLHGPGGLMGAQVSAFYTSGGGGGLKIVGAGGLAG